MNASATYTYRAARADGTVVRGVLAAASTDAASALLTAQGLWPITVSARRASIRPARTSLSTRDLATGLRVLASLLGTGLPVGRTLGAFEHMAPPAWLPALPAVAAAVREGHGLASALSRAPIAIPDIILGMLRAGEAGSGLAPAVQRAADYAEGVAAARAALRGALAYPVVLFGAGAASLVLLVGVVLPRFAAVLADLGQALPPTTAFVLATGAVLRTATPAASAVGLLVIGTWRVWVAAASGRRQWHALLLSLPVVGPVRSAAATGRVCAAWASLLESGVPAASGLQHAAAAGGDAAVAQRLGSARAVVVSGGRIAPALEDARALTPGAVRLVRAGEETGQLAAMLAHAAALETAHAERQLKGALRLLEPALVLLFGGVVALVAAALLQAVYNVRPTA